jgi:hypothetical protein
MLLQIQQLIIYYNFVNLLHYNFNHLMSLIYYVRWQYIMLVEEPAEIQ